MNQNKYDEKMKKAEELLKNGATLRRGTFSMTLHGDRIHVVEDGDDYIDVLGLLDINWLKERWRVVK